MDASKRRQHRRRTGFVKLDRSIFNTGVEQSDEILGLYVRLLAKVAYKTCFHRQYKVRPGQMIFSWRDLPELLYRSQKLRPSVNTLRTRMHILETIGAIHIASHPTKRFTVLSIRSVANFDTVAVANSDTVVDTVLDTVLDTVVDTVLDTPTPEISTKIQAKSSPKKEKKEKKEKKVGEGEDTRRRSLRYLEIQFSDLSEEVREALALEMVGAVASGAVHPGELEYRLGAWASKRRAKAQEKEFTF